MFNCTVPAKVERFTSTLEKFKARGRQSKTSGFILERNKKGGLMPDSCEITEISEGEGPVDSNRGTGFALKKQVFVFVIITSVR